jgi:hypothetical protein
MSRTLFRAAGRRAKTDSLSVGALISGLGDRSFGWSILLFSLLNLIPMPTGANMVTALPLILLTGQMAAGLDHVRLPRFIARREVNRRGFQQGVLRLKPIIRWIEKIVRTRHVWLFQPKNERIIGLLLLAVSVALFVPIPLNGFIPATALFITAFGLIERDGLVTLSGIVLGVISILITLVVGGMLWAGAYALAQQ